MWFLRRVPLSPQERAIRKGCSFCVCDPGSHVLSVASLYESAPSGRARIPLSPLINPRNKLVVNKLRGFSISPLPKIRPKSHVWNGFHLLALASVSFRRRAVIHYLCGSEYYLHF